MTEQPLTVGLLSTSFPRYPGDASGVFVFRLAKLLSSVCNVIVISPGDSLARSTEKMDAITIRRFSYFFPRRWQRVAYRYGIPENIRRHPAVLLQVPAFMLAFTWKVLTIARRVDVFHANWTPSALPALVAKWIYGKPVVVTLRGSDVRDLPSWFTRFVLRRVDCIVAIGAESALIRQLGFSATAIQTPIDYELFNDSVRSTDTALSLGLAPDRPIVAFVARLYHFKDPMTLVEAIPLVLRAEPRVQFAIVGDGVLLDAVRRRVKELGVESSVSVPGERSDVNEILSMSTVFVGISQIENVWSATITEATAIGIPCILSNAGRTIDYFTDGLDCLLIEPGDATGLAKAILKLIGDPDLASSLVKNCRALHRRHGHDASVIAKKHVEAYRLALDKNPAGRHGDTR